MGLSLIQLVTNKLKAINETHVQAWADWVFKRWHCPKWFSWYVNAIREAGEMPAYMSELMCDDIIGFIVGGGDFNYPSSQPCENHNLMTGKGVQ